jgi:hypothetical protein
MKVNLKLKAVLATFVFSFSAVVANAKSITCSSNWVYEDKNPGIYRVAINDTGLRISKTNFALEESNLFWGDLRAYELADNIVGFANNDQLNIGVFFKKEDFETRSEFRAKIKNFNRFYDIFCSVVRQ